MPTDFNFRLSTYLTLALACVSLGYAESDLFVELPFVAGAVVLVLVVLFQLETRVELLSIPAANRLGLLVGLVNVGWLGFRLAREIRHPVLVHVEWQLLLIAMLGPLLMMLMAAKLARREKHVGDYWALHGAALAAVCLSGAIAERPTCFVLLGLYAVCAVWSLMLFHLRRAGGAVLPIPGRPAGPVPTGVVAPEHPRAGVLGAVALSVVGGCVIVPLFLATPRSPGTKLEFGRSRVEIGYSADQMIDLNQTGDLEENDQIAFEVTAERDGAPVTDLSLEQRWRGRVMRHYSGGAWQPGDVALPSVTTRPSNPEVWSPPHLGNGQLTFRFTIPASTRGRFAADPLRWAADQPVPFAVPTTAGPQGWNWNGDGSFGWVLRRADSEPVEYLQVWHPGATGDSSPVFRIADADIASRKRPILYNPVPRAKEYADQVVTRLVRDGRLPANHTDPISRLPRYEYHERVARALADHLATTPDLQYSLSIRRERKELDPIEEFLFHTRAGHCERFATALAVLLRSQGIPSVLVLGFKGCEPTDSPGRYVVRQSHAHAWVTALIPVPDQDPTAPPRDTLYQWVSLDPTPAAPGDDAGAEAKKRSGLGSALREFFNDYIATYNSEKRRKALVAFRTWVTRWDVLGALAAVVTAGAIVRRVARRVRSGTDTGRPDVHLWFRELLVTLAAHGMKPEPGQTLREFAVCAASQLLTKPATRATADVPQLWVDVYYEVRFGDVALPPERLAVLRQRLAELQLALSGLGELA